MIDPTVLRGFSDAYGSWKTICMSRRSARSSSPLIRVMSLAVEPDLAVGGVEQPHRHARERALAAAGLADQTERLARIDLEVDAVDRVHRADLLLEDDAARDREVLLDALQPKERLAGRLGASPATASLRRRS